MLAAFRRSTHARTRSAWERGKEEETDPFDSPAKDGRLEVFRVCELATQEDSDRVDDAQITVKLSTRDIVVHTLLWIGQNNSIGEAYMSGLRTRR
jgi:hypothetical protein